MVDASNRSFFVSFFGAAIGQENSFLAVLFVQKKIFKCSLKIGERISENNCEMLPLFFDLMAKKLFCKADYLLALPDKLIMARSER